MPIGLPQVIDEPQPFGVAFDEQPEPVEPEQAPIVGMAPEPPPIDPGLAAQADELALAAPPVEPESAIGEVGQAPGVLPPDVVPTPEVGAPPIDFPELAVPADEADVSPLAIAAGQNEVVRTRQDAVDIARAERAELNETRGRLIRVLPTAKPAQQKKLAEKIAETDRALASSADHLDAAREAADTEQAVQESELGLAANRERQAAMANAQVDVDRARAEQEAKLAESQDREAEATAARDESIATYQRDMAAGPSNSTGVMMADILTEALNARMEGRTPNFGGALARHSKEMSAVFQRKQSAAMAGIKASGDKIADLAAGRRLMKAEGLEQDAAIMSAAAAEAERRIGLATTDAQEAQAVGLRDELAQAADTKRAQATIARGKYLQGQRDNDLDRQLKEANIRKAQAAAGKLETEAAKLARRGAGGAKRAEALTTQAQLRGLEHKMARDIEQRGVRGAGGLFLQNPDGSYALAKNAKIASALDETHVELQTVNDLLNELHSIRAEYGQEFRQGNSEAHQRMVGAMNQVKLALKNVYELGVLSESDEKILDGITGGDPSGWYDKRPTWLAIRERSEKAFGRKLRQKAGFQGKFRLQAPTEYTPPTRKEAVIKYRTHRGGDPAERMEMFKASLSATEGERGSKEEAYSQAHAEANSYIEQEGPKNLERLQKEFNAAVAKKTPEGDAEADRIDDKIEREDKFIFDMKRERTRLRRGVRGVVTQAAAEEKAVEEFETVRGTGATYAGKN